MTERRPVRLLPEVVANQIAAGEVIERPASVVKELVENALDSGATRIDIAIEGGGIKRIEVLDNGCGMDREDALASLQRQATSKIALSQDIEHIATFGFRGEAIPSIASVSRFTLITRTESSPIATALTVTGGTLENTSEAGHPQGTTVSVRDLFFNVPARRKFLRAASTELSRIRQSITAIAIANPTIAIRLQSDGRDLLRLPQDDTLEDRIRALLGDATMDALLPIDHTQNDIHIHGYIARPDFIRGGTPEQYIFVNRRPATAPQIQYALREAWQNPNQRPVVTLFIDLPPEEVDVNVHPAKREIRFRHGNLLINAILAAIRQTLQVQHTMPGDRHAKADNAISSHPSSGTPLPSAIIPSSPITSLHPAVPNARQTELPFIPYPTPHHLPQTITPIIPPAQPEHAVSPQLSNPPPATHQTLPPTPPNSHTLPYARFRVSDILEERYWIVITDQGLLTVHAKAALERILYERLAPSAAHIISQPLLIPETLHLPPVDADRVTRFLPELEACGFGIGRLGTDTFILDALPVMLSELPAKEILADIAAELDQTGASKHLDAWRREVVARAAAKAATRTYPIKDITVAQTLMAQLAQCAMPYTTPRGKPVMFLTTHQELARRFKLD